MSKAHATKPAQLAQAARFSRFSRREVLAAGGVLAAGVLLAGCGGTAAGGSEGSGSGRAWTFTDDRGTTARADATPKRIVAYVGAAAVLQDLGLGDRVVGVFGPTRKKNGSPDPQAGDLDVNKVTVVGNTYGEFNIEKYAALKPDLLIDNMYLPNELFFIPADSADKILKLAPSVGIATGKTTTMDKAIQRYVGLAESLGADTSTPKVTRAKARYEKAVADLTAAVKTNPGVKILAASGSADLFYASNPEGNADLKFFKELGVDIVTPDNVSADGYFEELSWENAGKYEADVILLDNRAAALQPGDLVAKPSWSQLPAVKAGQVRPWASEPRFSYAGFAPTIESLAQTIREAKKVT